jgi:hypothetical protein
VIAGSFKNSKMMRLAFNSNKEKSSEMVFDKFMLDPDTLIKDPAFPENFRVKIVMENVPEEEASKDEMHDQREGRDKILNILRIREKESLTVLDTQNLMFGDPDFDDRDEMMVVNFDVSGQSASEDADD